MWQVAYQSLLPETESYYVLVDSLNHTGVILPNVNTFSRRPVGSLSLRASWTEYLKLPPDIKSNGDLAHKALYIYTSRPGSLFFATLTAPDFTMSPP